MTEQDSQIIVVDSVPQQHLVVGVGALAAMDDAAFERNIEMLQRGQQRLVELTEKLLVSGQDYGRVPGIKKPFLQKPGAEKLCNFYGLAVRFEVDRIEGDGVIAPNLAYHVRAYAHLRDFDGPVVAQGFGEANTWEERYRWRDAKPTCPACNREGLIRGKPDGKLKGKWWCPSREGGCNRTFEAADPAVIAGGKVENPDPWGLANTLIKMAEKRAHVDVTLRATGTSGFFTQDEDSPSVTGQAEPEHPGVEVQVVADAQVERGGRDTHPTDAQIAMLGRISKERDLGPDRIAEVLTRLGNPVSIPEGSRAKKGQALLLFVRSLTADEVGALLNALETGEVPQ